jgi:hypothetical protein
VIDSAACPLPSKQMKTLVIAGTYAQYRDFLVLHRLNEQAAPYINGETQLRAYDPDIDEVWLVGTYHDNPAYQSGEYLCFQGQRLPAVLAI